MVANAEARVVAAEAKAAEARSLADRADRAAASDREALASAAARTESLAGSLASAERRAGALAPTGGGLLETPLGWRGVQTANASVVAEMGTSAHLGGAKQTRGGEAATNPDEKSVGVSKPLDPCPPVFIPDRDPYALDATEDGAPSTSGVVVTLLPGGKIVTFAALAVSTPSATTRWDLDPAAKWLAAETEAVAGAAPPARESPAVCALPAATAAVAAAAAGADPAGVVGGVFVYGGFDGSAEMSDAHVLLRRVTDAADVGLSPPLPAWEWIRVARDASSLPPRAVARVRVRDAAALRRLGGGAGRLRDGRERAHGRVRARRVRGSSRTSRRRRNVFEKRRRVA